MYSEPSTLNNDMPAQLLGSSLRQITLVVFYWERKGIDYILAQYRKEVDGYALVRIVPDIEVVFIRLVSLQMAEKRVVCLRCCCPIFQRRSKRIVS